MNKAITKFNSQLGRYEPSSSSTKELHGNSLNIGVKQQKKTYKLGLHSHYWVRPRHLNRLR